VSYYNPRFFRYRTRAKKERARTIDFLTHSMFHALVDGNVKVARRMFREVAAFAAKRPERRRSRGKQMRFLVRWLERRERERMAG